jgi:protein-L-isoaspartate(D-aspartate) O-methyltransferase
MTDFTIARQNMIESQVRPNGITDGRVIAAMSAVPRELFVPAQRQDFAYMDEDVLIRPAGAEGPARYLMEPMAFARLVQLASVTSTDRVLEIGTGSGYGAAVLSRLAASVTALEADTQLAGLAQHNLSAAGATATQVVTGDLSAGWPGGKPYDVILFSGRVPHVPQAVIGQLAEGGRLVAVLGSHEMGRAWVYTRNGGALSERSAFDASVAALPGFAPARPAFVF